MKKAFRFFLVLFFVDDPLFLLIDIKITIRSTTTKIIVVSGLISGGIGPFLIFA